MDKINIREATKSDSPEIVELLKIALGEGTEKSVSNWHWKHYDNPFGVSKIYVAVIGEEIVGVRAFMQWRWLEKSSGKILKAVRAVDTAVSPNHRRKGIFLTLTNHALQKVKEEGFDFIFNTPNDKSIGGYLKLGWVLNRKIPANIILNPLWWLYSRKKLAILSKKTVETINKNKLDFTSAKTQSTLVCPFTVDFFNWRYVQNPLANYQYFQFNQSILLIYRIKKTKKMTECRVVDIQLLQSDAGKYIKKAISKLIKRYPIVSMDQGILSKHIWQSPFFTSPTLHREGPNMVTKNVNLKENEYDSLLDIHSMYWGFNLGDMELF